MQGHPNCPPQSLFRSSYKQQPFEHSCAQGGMSGCAVPLGGQIWGRGPPRPWKQAQSCLGRVFWGPEFLEHGLEVEEVVRLWVSTSPSLQSLLVQ